MTWLLFQNITLPAKLIFSIYYIVHITLEIYIQNVDHTAIVILRPHIIYVINIGSSSQVFIYSC